MLCHVRTVPYSSASAKANPSGSRRLMIQRECGSVSSRTSTAMAWRLYHRRSAVKVRASCRKSSSASRQVTGRAEPRAARGRRARATRRSPDWSIETTGAVRHRSSPTAKAPAMKIAAPNHQCTAAPYAIATIAGRIMPRMKTHHGGTRRSRTWSVCRTP